LGCELGYIPGRNYLGGAIVSKKYFPHFNKIIFLCPDMFENAHEIKTFSYI
jgi:hypothetical protein